MISLGAAVGIQAGEAPRWQWKLGDFTWIKRQPAEPGAVANAHPVRIDAEALRQELSAIRFISGADSKALFDKDELVPLLEAFREALAVAGPGDDLVLLSTHRRGGGFLSTPYGLTARFFVLEGGLNVIVHDTRLEFLDRYHGMQVLPEFLFGSRATASGVELQSPTASSKRKDWLSIPLERLVAPQRLPAAVLVAPPPKASPAPAPSMPEAAPKAKDAAFFEEQEKRLRALKRMREENLITEEEYQQKRREILQNL